jgi:hypothetical protein
MLASRCDSTIELAALLWNDDAACRCPPTRDSARITGELRRSSDDVPVLARELKRCVDTEHQQQARAVSSRVNVGARARLCVRAAAVATEKTHRVES